MRADRCAGRLAVAVDEVEDAGGRPPRRDLGEDLAREGRDLGRLEDDRAAGRERRRDLQAIWLTGQFQGVMKPQTQSAPWRHRRAAVLLELVGLRT